MIPYSPMVGLLFTLAVAAILSAFLLLISPFRVPRNFKHGAVEKARANFDSLEKNGRIIEFICCFSLFLPIAFGWYRLEQYLLLPRMHGNIFAFANPIDVYIIPSMFLSFLIGGFLAYYLIFLSVSTKGIGTREEFAIWSVLWEQKKLKDPRGIAAPPKPEVKKYAQYMAIVTVLIVFGAFLMSFVFLDCYTVITPDRITINSMLELREHEYPYDQVDHILLLDRIKLRSGVIETQEKPEYRIFFRDGTRTTTRYWPYGIPGDQLRESVEYISSRSGVPIRKGIVNVDVPADLL